MSYMPHPPVPAGSPRPPVSAFGFIVIVFIAALIAGATAGLVGGLVIANFSGGGGFDGPDMPFPMPGPGGFDDMMQDARWSEGKTAAATIRTTIDVYKAKYYQDKWEPVSGTWTELWEHFEGNRIYDLMYFNEEDFYIDFFADGSFVITVDGDASSNPEAPSGVFTISSDGTTTGP
jgi:hypothetical protein